MDFVVAFIARPGHGDGASQCQHATLTLVFRSFSILFL